MEDGSGEDQNASCAPELISSWKSCTCRFLSLGPSEALQVSKSIECKITNTTICSEGKIADLISPSYRVKLTYLKM
jgi:hypothetical protein